MLRNKKENDNFPDKDNYDIKVNKKAKEDSNSSKGDRVTSSI